MRTPPSTVLDGSAAGAHPSVTDGTAEVVICIGRDIECTNRRKTTTVKSTAEVLYIVVKQPLELESSMSAPVLGIQPLSAGLVAIAERTVGDKADYSHLIIVSQSLRSNIGARNQQSTDWRSGNADQNSFNQHTVDRA